MKPLHFLKTAAVPAALITSALIVAARANYGPPAPVAPAKAASDTSHFKEGNGVRLGKAAWDFIRPETAEIQVMEVAPELKTEARVYAAAADPRPALASAMLPAGAVLTVGDAVQLSGLSGEPSEWLGKIAQIDRQMESASRQIEAIIEIADPDKRLAAGTFLSLRSVSAGAKKASVPVAPQSAVVQSSKGSFVYAENGSYFLRTPVKLGARHKDQVEIVDGLFEGDKVVSKGADALWMVELQATNGGKSCCAAGH